MDEVITLYHGARTGLNGDINPKLNEGKPLDFGYGFYLGTKLSQVSSLAANGSKPTIYEYKLFLNRIAPEKVLLLKDMQWTFYVLYHRQYMEDIPQLRDTAFYRYYAGLDKGKSLVIGPIADDSMFLAMREFKDGIISDATLHKALTSMNLGYQYVIKDASLIHDGILTEVHHKVLTQKDKLQAIHNKQKQLETGGENYRTLRRKRYAGKYIDEILEEYIQAPDKLPVDAASDK